ncbi:hypothetical protein TEA_009694 [Camellia sinensis var. sinensis]|uniref:Uncharacterized protein n=1 Tax=Camellia sinensis var. sinensis TaxID=542762 RepID=A0A4S4EIJ4_CAMSN|nr:hypothetical protein TEA_009694 [Camellia sinensis var. sinensis]
MPSIASTQHPNQVLIQYRRSETRNWHKTSRRFIISPQTLLLQWDSLLPYASPPPLPPRRRHKSGQKKTNNFDACHERREEAGGVAEEAGEGCGGSDAKRVKIWKGKRKVGDTDNDDMDERKIEAGGVNGSDVKRVKIWMGKREVGDNDNDDVDEDDSDGDEEEENDESVILDNGNGSDSNKEAKCSLGSVTSWNRDGESSGGVSAESGSEGEETAIRGSSFVVESSDAGMVGSESNDAGEPALGTLGEKDGPEWRCIFIRGDGCF